ncbi:MAG: helix-turn-helix domain-containing protein [Solirubrobacterales bacterium]|nr:helix-turn-helix domain-containing protein [Solirubrobacterales bacterium]
MPEIGSTLREARMRARIDISEIETETKIRAKYLRALENEEWELLPGSTYVKSFLRTYAEALDLDAKLLVDEYKLRHENLSDVEMQPISAAAPGLERRRRSGPLIPRGVVIGVVFAGLVVALYALGQSSDDDEPTRASTIGSSTGTATDDRPAEPAPSADDDSDAPERPPRPRRVRLQIVATGPVFVCLRGGDRTLVNGETLQAGDATGVFRSRRFRLTVGNNNVRLRINRRPRTLEPSSGPIGLEITPRRGRRPLSADERPTCR